MSLRFAILALCTIFIGTSYAQDKAQCPENIGFETGTFANWKIYAGSISGTSRENSIPPVITLSESPAYGDQHAMIKRGSEKDKFGKFSLNSPNGSEYVVRLGNDRGGRGAERLSYTIDVPANVDAYSVIFNYAVVLQNPSHRAHEQPKFTVEIYDQSSSVSTSCGSFEFVAGGSLPGFQSSETDRSVLFKNWSPVLLNLTDYLGHTIRLDFTTNDCTFEAHFGYVYLDFTENCAYPVTGNIVCPGAENVTLRTLTGFANYRWFDANTKEELGTEDSLVLPNAMDVGRTIGVQLTPYDGLGCIQTLYTTLEGPKVQVTNPPPDCTSVNLTAASVTAGSPPGLKYSYWRDKDATIALSNPAHVVKSGSYYIKGDFSAGCSAISAVIVKIIDPPVIFITDPEPVSYPATVDITNAYIPDPAITYTYWKDSKANIAVENPKKINRDATFYIKATNSSGCYTIVPVVANIIYTGVVIPNAFTPNADGINDVLTVLMDNSIKVNSFKIFNQWGQVVFVTADIYSYWDGTRNGTPAPVGTYYWFCDAVRASKEEYRISGSVAVLR